MSAIQAAAVAKVSQAIRKGELKKPTEFKCVDCGKAATQYDHRDYNKPLEVQPVCASCNAMRGPAIGSTCKGPGSKQSYEVTMALRWLRGKDKRTVAQAAKRFKVHESTLWRAIGKQKLNGG
jgi:hypothetical protein